MTSTEAPMPFPFTAPNPFEPPPEYAALRASQPVVQVALPGGACAWLVTRHEDNRALLADARLSRAATAAAGAPRLQPIPPDPRSLITMDPPEHTRLRRLVARAFTSRRAEGLRPRVQEITDDLLDAMIAGGSPGDLVAQLAQPLPMAVICELLGVPYEDRDRFLAWADIVLSMTAYSPPQVRAARDGLNAYLAQLVAAKHRRPGDDLLSALVGVEEEGDLLTEEELVTLGSTLLTAGFHTTSNQIVLSCACLLRHPAQFKQLLGQPELLNTAVEELFRYNSLSGSGGLIRIATQDIELGGVRIQAGQAVLPAISSANRDAEVFEAPDVLDLSRSENPHITFGHGAHYCLGGQLARVELQVALGTLLRRLPDVRLAVAESDLDWRTGRIFRGLAALPVTW
jgi:cytochrome P450